MPKTTFEIILEALNAAGVRYLVAGGVAVVLHGRLRTTADLDLVVALDQENVLRTVGALEGLGFRPRAPVPFRDLANRAKRNMWIHEKWLRVFSVWSPSYPGTEVDLFVEEPFPFDDAEKRAAKVELEAIRVPVVSIDDLIAMKRKAGRPIDQSDIEALEAMREKK